MRSYLSFLFDVFFADILGQKETNGAYSNHFSAYYKYIKIPVCIYIEYANNNGRVV